MMIGYMRVSKSDGSQTCELQYDALVTYGVHKDNIYEDKISGKNEERPGLSSCLKALRSGDILVVWKLDRLGRNLKHLVSLVHELNDKKIGLKVLAGNGAHIDTTTSNGKLIFGIFAALAEFERELICERTKAGLEAARARGRKGGGLRKMTRSKLKIALTSMQNQKTNVAELCRELSITRQTLYRHIAPNGTLRIEGQKVLEIKENMNS